MNRTTRYRRCAAAGLVLMLAACSRGQVHAPRNTGLYLLIDTSGTYNRQVTKAEQIILVALSKLQPTDSFAVARIEGSYTNVVGLPACEVVAALRATGLLPCFPLPRAAA